MDLGWDWSNSVKKIHISEKESQIDWKKDIIGIKGGAKRHLRCLRAMIWEIE